MSLVLSLFPGLGLLDRAFEAEGFCVVRGPDVIWGGDVRTFQPPADRFDGVIGGPPCQAFSGLANLVRAKGLEPRFGNLIPEFSRCVELASPRFFLMENVLKAPEPEPEGYNVVSFILNNCWLGEAQRRKRRFWYGTRGETPNLRRWIPGAALELAESELAVCGNDGRMPDDRRRVKKAPVTGRHDGAVGSPQKSYEPERRTLADMLELQGLPRDWFDHQPWTVSAKRKMIGNGVPVPMGRAIAGAIRKALAS